MEPQAQTGARQVLITRNSDYRIEAGVCTAVRPHEKNMWITKHPAVGRRLLGALSTEPAFSFAKYPSIGMRLLFSNDVVTSPLVAIQ